MEQLNQGFHALEGEIKLLNEYGTEGPMGKAALERLMAKTLVFNEMVTNLYIGGDK